MNHLDTTSPPIIFPPRKLLSAALCLTTLLSLSGCAQRRLPLAHRTENIRSEPAWIFDKPGPGQFSDEYVVMAVGVNAYALEHEATLAIASDNARKRLQDEISAFAAEFGERLLAGLETDAFPDGILQTAVAESADQTGQNLAETARRVAEHESLLRREVFVKKVAPVEKITLHFTQMLRDELHERLSQTLDTEEIEILMEDFERALARL